MRIITLTTDFGTQDWFVGAMKGVIARVAPRARTIDITHEIPSGAIRAGAFALAAAYHYFPKDSVHVAVVDPGVGSARKLIAAQTANYLFVGPDNGLLSFALRKEKVKALRALEIERYFLHPVSQTFHGRDVLAPVAAHLSRGLRIQQLGPELKEFVRLDWPEARRIRDEWLGEIIYIDGFGNAITNVETDAVSGLGGAAREVRFGGKRLCAVAAHYQSVPRNQPVTVPGSSGFLEIALNGGSAAQRFGLKVGDAILVRPARK